MIRDCSHLGRSPVKGGCGKNFLKKLIVAVLAMILIIFLAFLALRTFENNQYEHGLPSAEEVKSMQKEEREREFLKEKRKGL